MSRTVVQGAMGLLSKLGTFTFAPAEDALRYASRGKGVGYETAWPNETLRDKLAPVVANLIDVWRRVQTIAYGFDAFL